MGSFPVLVGATIYQQDAQRKARREQKKIRQEQIEDRKRIESRRIDQEKRAEFKEQQQLLRARQKNKGQGGATGRQGTILVGAGNAGNQVASGAGKTLLGA